MTRELLRFQELGASFFRAAAGRTGLAVTDLEVINTLAVAGPMTAGQLAELTGLTTGAITGMINRLEDAGLVRRERDPSDGRRVIIHLATGTDAPREVTGIFDSIRGAWGELAAQYDDEQVAMLLAFLERGNALSRREILRVRETPGAEGGVYSVPLGELTRGQLVVTGAARLTVRADARMDALYQARFEGPTPEVKAKDGVVAIRYPRRLWILSAGQHSGAEVSLNTAIPWQVTIQGGVSIVTAELGGLTLAGVEVKGGMSTIRLQLPAPSGVVPVRISGGASEIIIRRPAGSAARVHLKGWVSMFVFDGQSFSDLGNDVRLHSPDAEAVSQRYDIEVSSSASMVTITTE